MSAIERQRDETARAQRYLIQHSILAALLGGGYLIGQVTPTPVLVFMLVMVIGTALTAVVAVGVVRGRTRKQNERTQRAEIESEAYKRAEEKARDEMFHLAWVAPAEDICRRIDEACGPEEPTFFLTQQDAVQIVKALDALEEIWDNHERLLQDHRSLEAKYKRLEQRNKDLTNTVYMLRGPDKWSHDKKKYKNRARYDRGYM